MAMLADVLSWTLLTLGGAFVFIGGLGALRLPDLYSRIHAASLTDGLGAVLIIFGVMLQAGASLATIKLAAILLFLLLTSPTASNALASAAMLAGLRPGEPTAEKARAAILAGVRPSKNTASNPERGK